MPDIGGISPEKKDRTMECLAGKPGPPMHQPGLFGCFWGESRPIIKFKEEYLNNMGISKIIDIGDSKIESIRPRR